MKLAKRLNNISESSTFKIAAKAKKMQKEGLDIIDLTIGVLLEDTPYHIKASAIEAIHSGFTKYTPIAGCTEVREAVCHKYANINRLSYSPTEIIVSNGAKQSIMNAVFALINPGDEVIIPTPCWSSYTEIVKLAGGVPVLVKTLVEHNHILQDYQLSKAISKKTKMVIINYPSNPTGASISINELRALSVVLQNNPNIFIISDDIYESLQWHPDGINNIVNVLPPLKQRTILISGVSKCYCMTGWRIGYAAADKSIIEAMTKIQSQTTSGPCSISQAAAVEALMGTQNSIEELQTKIRKRLEFVKKEINSFSEFKIYQTQGAFYLWINIADAIKKLNLKSDIEYCDLLLDKAHIATTPGTSFYAPNHMRITLTSTHRLVEFIKRLKKFQYGNVE
jgi:aspartate aminotransferase